MGPMSSRRAFLKSVLAATPFPVAADPGERYWEMVRRQFPFSESRVPLNAGNLCPSPRVVSEQVEALTQDIDHDVSYTNRAKFAGLLEDSRAADGTLWVSMTRTASSSRTRPAFAAARCPAGESTA